MNPAYLIGLALCVVLCVLGIVFDGVAVSGVAGSLGRFVNLPGLLITVGGTLAALAAAFPPEQTMRMFKHMPIILGFHRDEPVHYVNTLTDLSAIARRRGLRGLEEAVRESDDGFLRGGIMLVVDAIEPAKVREQLEKKLDNIEERHAQSWELYDRGAALAPGFGMIGTVIGLINMLGSMNFADEGGASRLAAGLALAFVSTLYGLLLANLAFIPMGTQLRARHASEMLCKEIIIEGVVSIQAGENPRHIHEKLMSFLTGRQRVIAEAYTDAPE